MADNNEYVRFTVRSLKDMSSGAYPLTDYGRDISAMERALKAVLPDKAFYHKAKEINYNDPTFHQIGKLKEDFYVKKDYAMVAQGVLDQLLQKLVYKGTEGEDENGEATKPDPKYWVTRARSLSTKESVTVQELEKLTQKNNESEGGAEGFRFRKGTLLKLLAIVTTLTDITRRILSSVMTLATQQVRDSVEAHNLGISRERLRDYRRAELMHGMKEGTFEEAISGEQQKYGNIASLDEESLKYIALIMGDKVSEMATMGLGSSNPEAIVEAIVDRANELANKGQNSLGMYVGEQQARRELYSYLMKYSSSIANIFATMQEEQNNINSIFRNQADTFAKFRDSAGFTRNSTQAGEGVLVTLGQEWNVFKKLIEDMKYTLSVTLAPILAKILQRVNNMRVGMSASEKLRVNAENRDANARALASAKATVEYLNNKPNLTESEVYYKETLVSYIKNLEKENNKKEIDNIVMTENQIKAEQEARIRGEAKFKKDLILSGEANLDDERYASAYKFTNDDIMKIIESQGNTAYGEKAFEKFQKEYVTNRMKNLSEEEKHIPERYMRSKAESESVQAFARRYLRFFYPILLDLQAESLIQESYNDQVYDINRARAKWGANFEDLPNAIPIEKLEGKHKLYSVDVKDGSTIIHKLILDINDSNGVDKGDFELDSWTGNDRGGANGSQAELSYDRSSGVKVNALRTSASSMK